jgi:hypothetical protein
MFSALVAANETASQADERLGSLLYSTQERMAIVKARKANSVEEISRVFTVTGIVKRGKGKSTVWINSKPVPEGQSVPFIGRTTISASSVTLDGQQLRVGETLDTTTHLRTDMVTPGAVTQRKPGK